MLQECVKPGNHVIDATVGNGFDTLFLSELVGKKGTVLSFDIQQQAIENTKMLLEKHHSLENVQLIHDSHENIHHYLPSQEIAAAIFNLGYLPGSDKAIITAPKSTITAIRSVKKKLSIGGRIVIVCYWGHEGGLEELKALRKFLPTLSQKNWTVLEYQFINQQHQPPICFVIERKK